MTKAVTPNPSRASKRHRERLRQRGDEMLQRLSLVTEALEYYGHVYMQRTVVDAQFLIKLLMNELLIGGMKWRNSHSSIKRSHSSKRNAVTHGRRRC